MPDRPYWEEMKEYIYDDVGEVLRTQEEIDARVEDAFSIYSDFTSNMDEIGEEFKARIRTFIDPIDLIRYLEEGGVPPECVEVWIHEDEGDYEYHVFISDTTP